jgi:hypothetical protein
MTETWVYIGRASAEMAGKKCREKYGRKEERNDGEEERNGPLRCSENGTRQSHLCRVLFKMARGKAIFAVFLDILHTSKVSRQNSADMLLRA